MNVLRKFWESELGDRVVVAGMITIMISTAIAILSNIEYTKANVFEDNKKAYEMYEKYNPSSTVKP